MKRLKYDFRLKNFILLFIAGTVNALGITLFLYPVALYDSGISGISMLLDRLTPEFLTISIFLVVLNIPIFIYGLKKQGLVFTIYSIFSVLIYSIVAFLIINVLPIDIKTESPFAGSDIFLCAIFGGTISGIGSGLVIRGGGAIDGIDVLSVLFAKKIGLSVGNFNLIFNFVLYVVCGIIFNSWELPLYSILTYFIGSRTIDFIVDGLDRSKCAMIVTTKAKEITEVLSKEFSASGTFVDAVGGYSQTKKNILYFVVNHFQINKLRNIVLTIDEDAFISTLDVSDVIRKHKTDDLNVTESMDETKAVDTVENTTEN